MIVRRGLAALTAALLLGACAPATPSAPTPPTAPAPAGATAVLDEARELARELGRREAELESIAP